MHWRDPSTISRRKRRDSVWVRRSYDTYLRGSRRFLYEVSSARYIGVEAGLGEGVGDG